MTYRLSYGTVRESQRRAIHVLRVENGTLTLAEIENLAERMRERLQHRGELTAEVVIIQRFAKETLRLFGAPYAATRVRAAMFNTAVSWAPFTLE